MTSTSSVLRETESSPDFAGFPLSKSHLLRDFESFVLIFYNRNKVLRFMQIYANDLFKMGALKTTCIFSWVRF